MKIVINSCYGSFGLSEKAYKYLGLKWDGYGTGVIGRANPKLVKCVEELGEDASGLYATLKVVEIPDNIKWQIERYNGLEWVAEKHRTWK